MIKTSCSNIFIHGLDVFLCKCFAYCLPVLAAIWDFPSCDFGPLTSGSLFPIFARISWVDACLLCCSSCLLCIVVCMTSCCSLVSSCVSATSFTHNRFADFFYLFIISSISVACFITDKTSTCLILSFLFLFFLWVRVLLLFFLSVQCWFSSSFLVFCSDIPLSFIVYSMASSFVKGFLYRFELCTRCFHLFLICLIVFSGPIRWSTMALSVICSPCSLLTYSSFSYFFYWGLFHILYQICCQVLFLFHRYTFL